MECDKEIKELITQYQSQIREGKSSLTAILHVSKFGNKNIKQVIDKLKSQGIQVPWTLIHNNEGELLFAPSTWKKRTIVSWIGLTAICVVSISMAMLSKSPNFNSRSDDETADNSEATKSDSQQVNHENIEYSKVNSMISGSMPILETCLSKVTNADLLQYYIDHHTADTDEDIAAERRDSILSGKDDEGNRQMFNQQSAQAIGEVGAAQDQLNNLILNAAPACAQMLAVLRPISDASGGVGASKDFLSGVNGCVAASESIVSVAAWLRRTGPKFIYRNDIDCDIYFENEVRKRGIAISESKRSDAQEVAVKVSNPLEGHSSNKIGTNRQDQQASDNASDTMP
ncbi:hypothetical protein [Novosphingobium sp.]|uniref:hypothetical protein n=1 Tax=Novosphingobium sp. TaxID=1874826 RepID=UPI002600878A|nr:hypothetical protein [Novosphingobium sp.]